MTVRTVVCRVEGLNVPGPWDAILSAVAGMLGGGLGVEWLRGRQRKSEKDVDREEAVTLRILDDGTQFREILLQRVESLTTQERDARERAHAAELRAAIAEEHLDKLKGRLERKDERLKILQALLSERGVEMPPYLRDST